MAASWSRELDQPSPQPDHAQRYWQAPVILSTAVGDPTPDRLDGDFRLLAESLPMLCWIGRGDGAVVWYNRRWHDYCGTTPSAMEGWGWQAVHDAAELPAVLEWWRNAITTGHPAEMVFPLRGADGVFRPFLTRIVPVRDASGALVRWLGVHTEIGAQVAAEAQQMDVLSKELSHRIKNIFAVIAGLVRISGRRHAALKPLTSDLVARIAALGRAHEFARPHNDASKPATGSTSLQGLLTKLLSPYLDSHEGQIAVAGDDLPLDDRGATPLALVIHELATNAIKYGALSTADGRLDLRVTRRGALVDMDWIERGGPRVDGPPPQAGFGTLLTKMSVEQQLGGTITRDWRPEGLAVNLVVKASGLSRG